MKNHIKWGIGALGIIIIAIYICSLSLYGKEQINATEYIIHSATTILCILSAFIISKSPIQKNKIISAVLYTTISISGLFVILHFSSKSPKLNAQMIITGIWPVICSVLAKYINDKKTTGYIVADFAIFNIFTISLIWILEEFALKYNHFSADITAEIYMYITALSSFLVFAKKTEKHKNDKYSKLFIIVSIIIISSLWLYNHDRVYEIIRSFEYDKTYSDADGLHSNWLIHRISMVSTSFTGNFSKFNHYILPSVAQGCPVVWLSASGGRHIGSAIFVLCTIITFLLIVNMQKSDNGMVKAITISFVTKMIFGVITNIFLIYSTSVGLPLIQTPYDIIPLAYILFDFGKEKNELISP